MLCRISDLDRAYGLGISADCGYDTEYRLRNSFVDFSRILQMHRISDVRVDSRCRENQLHPRLPVAAGTQGRGSLDFLGLPEDFLAVLQQNVGHGRGQLLFGAGIVDTAREPQGDFAPDEVDAVDLLE